MTLEEIQEALPVGCRVMICGEHATVVSHHLYSDRGDRRRHNTYYVGYKRDKALYGTEHTWPEEMTLLKPLTPLELDLKRYIDEEMKQLVG